MEVKIYLTNDLKYVLFISLFLSVFVFKFLSFFFKLKDKQHSELQELRLNIRKCFKNLDCYLMPHPGLRVCTSPEFDGKLKDVEKDFKYNVQKFVENIFAQPVSCKEIYGKPISGYELFEYFKVIFISFLS
jgi:atlastin